MNKVDADVRSRYFSRCVVKVDNSAGSVENTISLAMSSTSYLASCRVKTVIVELCSFYSSIASRILPSTILPT